MDPLLSFLISYVANNVPLIKDLFKKDENKEIEKRLQESFSRALNIWSGDDDLRKLISLNHFPSIQSLQRFCANFNDEGTVTSLQSLISLWVRELEKEPECVEFIHSLNLTQIKDDVNVIGQKLDIIIDIFNKIKDSNYIDITDALQLTKYIPRGRTKHQEVEDYIRRYCTDERNSNSWIGRYFGEKRSILAEFVIGLKNNEKNNFILFSSAQTGKTTELHNLCYELQESGLFLPVLFEVRLNDDLKREHLPKTRFIGGKEVIIVIDALDEVSGKEYDQLIKEIAAYAFDNPEIRILLSCRSNYGKESLLNGFQSLYLENLEIEDVSKYIDRKLGRGNDLLNAVAEKGTIDLALNPFFLKYMVEVYKENPNELPFTKNEFYEIFFSRCFDLETADKKLIQSEREIDEYISELERVALAMSLINRQWLTKKELCSCLGGDKSNLDEHLRIDILQVEDGKFSFKQNIFREWLVARFLHRNGLPMVKKLACHPNGKIKRDWHNIMVIWLSFYNSSHKEETDTIVKWLLGASKNLLIYIDKNLLSENVRETIFKAILLDYKAKGIRIRYDENEIKGLIELGYSENTVKFLIDEMKLETPGTVYFSNLTDLVYYLDWDNLFKKHFLTWEAFSNIIFEKLEYGLQEQLFHPSSIYFLENKFFAKHFISQINDILTKYDFYYTVKVMIGVIDLAGKVEEHVDYILEKERFVKNQHRGSTTEVVTRDEIYNALSKVKTEENIIKVLSHKFDNNYLMTSYEHDAYIGMIKSMVEKSKRFITGNIELRDVLEKVFLDLTKSHYYCHRSFGTDTFPSLVETFRNCYIGAGLKPIAEERFIKEFEDENTWNNHEAIEKMFHSAALWISEDDIKRYFDNFNPESYNDFCKAAFFCEIPVDEQREIAEKLTKSKFKKFDNSASQALIRKNEFEEILNYRTFKNSVSRALDDIKEGMNRVDVHREKREKKIEINPHVLTFLDMYWNSEDGYCKDEIIKALEDTEIYERIVMKIITLILVNGDVDNLIDEDIKKRIAATAEKIIGEGIKSYGDPYMESALILLLHGVITVKEDQLPTLLPYGKFSTYIQEEKGGAKNSYSVYEYVFQNTSPEILTPYILEELPKKSMSPYGSLKYEYSQYILSHRIQDGYVYVLEYAVSNEICSANALDLMIEKGILIDEIKDVLSKKTEDDRFWVYDLFLRHQRETDWIKESLENEFSQLSETLRRMAIRDLLRLGSIKALKYLKDNIEVIKPDDDISFNFSDKDSIDLLIDIMEYIIENPSDKHSFALTSILGSLERIATSKEEFLYKITEILTKLANKENKFNFLNYYIEQFEDKYYEAQNDISDVQNALLLIQN